MSRLREALDFLRTNGWVGSRHHMGLPGKTPAQSRMCMGNALWHVYGYPGSGSPNHQSWWKDKEALAEVCGEQYPQCAHYGSFGRIWRTNDDQFMTFPEIERLMEKAAIRREEMVE